MIVLEDVHRALELLLTAKTPPILGLADEPFHQRLRRVI
jgi:hypothetical protein